MGGLFSGSKTSTTNQTTNTGPSQFQSGYLKNAFDAAQTNYNSSASTPFYQGDLYAGMSDEQKQALKTQAGYAATTGLDTAQQLSSIGQGLLGNSKTSQDLLKQYTDLASTDATKSNIAAAGQYADNPYLDGQIDAVNRDVSRQLSEVTLPGIDRAASGTGNLNSSRAGVAAGIAQRGAEDRMADNAAQLRGDAYNRGLSLASQDRANNLSALSTAAGQYANLGSQGISAIGAGTAAASSAFDTINQAYGADQADRQGQADAAYKTWQGNDTRSSDLLKRYYDIIGSNQWGTSGTTSGTNIEKSNPSLLSSILGTAATVSSFL